ncbi:aldo/keto reductase [Ensifer sp. ENS02]|uniref:aldo/keto reductase n=1 Tax=Ensifer sp. ENS02 TaxID=2769290 RepID=UPI00177B9336|nr:aldo/keto reductase [Ensifer sp. ENS02]
MAPLPTTGLHLGLGLLSIGRNWGVADVPPLDDEAAAVFLANASQCAVRIFDTAPSYASSERRLGKHLATLIEGDRRGLTIMTKMGEYWNPGERVSVVDHSLDRLKRGIDRSLEVLGHIDVMQVHKASVEIVDHPDIKQAIDYARKRGIESFGASVSSPEAALKAVGTGLYASIQFPFNAQSLQFEQLAAELSATGITPIINRPFGMGRAVDGHSDPAAAAVAAYRFIADRVPSGVVLSGTSKSGHLRENQKAFTLAVSS